MLHNKVISTISFELFHVDVKSLEITKPLDFLPVKAFNNNDVPGVMTVNASRHYLNRYGVLTGKEIESIPTWLLR